MNKTIVHLFKPSGKWYMEVEIDMNKYQSYELKQAVIQATKDEFGNLEDFILVCIEPNHPHSHPQLIFNKEYL